jgi:hypothetical protein
MSPTTTTTHISLSRFPDGLKTSGQHAPISSLLTPPSSFPKEISGPTVWRPEDYRENPERWTHVFSLEEIEELGGAAEEFIRGGRGLVGMAKVGELLSLCWIWRLGIFWEFVADLLDRNISR